MRGAIRGRPKCREACAGRLAAAAVLAVAALACGTAVVPAQGTATEPPAAAAQPDPEAGVRRRQLLDAAFAALAGAASEAEAGEFAAEVWRLWTQSGRADVDALMSRAAAAMGSRDLGLASIVLDEVVELAPTFAEGWNRRATLRWMLGDAAGSLADIEKVLALEPRHFGALVGRAGIHADAGRHKEALADYRRALAANPFLADRHRVLPALQRRARDL